MEDAAREVEYLPLSATEKKQLIKARIGQGEFKRDLLKLSDKCRLCSIVDVRFLIGSHLRPWSRCDLSDERLDPYNGIQLYPNHDSLFDMTTKAFMNIRDTDVIPVDVSTYLATIINLLASENLTN